MKAVIAFLLGLSAVTYATTTTESGSSEDSFVWSSQDDTNDDTNNDDADQSYNGLVIRVFQEGDESPTIALGSKDDEEFNIYCLKFLGFFESEDYDTSVSEDATYTVVANSSVLLDDSQCDLQDITDTTFKIYCNNVSDAYLSLTFAFTQDEEGDYGLEYTIILGDYTWTSNDVTAQLVMQQSVVECSEALVGNTNDDPDTDTNAAPGRRLLQDADTDNDTDADTDADTDVDTDNDADDDTDGDTEDTNDDDTDDTENADDNDDNEDDTNESDEDEESGDDNTNESASATQGSQDSEDTSNSAEESAGISSDDSGEFDEGNARFVLNGQAFDQCDVSTGTDNKVSSKLVYQSNAEELHIVFSHFNCELEMDPRFLIDESKVKDDEQGDGVERIQSVVALMVGCVLVWML